MNITDNLTALVANKAKSADVFHAQVATHMDTAIAELKRQVPDVAWQIGKTVQAADRTAFRYTISGTQAGQKVTWTGSAVAVMQDGKILTIQVREDAWARLIDGGSIPKIPQDDISSNHWHGSAFGIDFTAALGQEGNKVSGTLSAHGLPSADVTGSNDGNHVTLSGPSPVGGGNMTFTGQWTGANKISGSISGAAITFSRG